MKQAAPLRPGEKTLPHIVLLMCVFSWLGCGEAETPPPVPEPIVTAPAPTPATAASEETPNTAPAEPQRSVRLAVHIPEQGMADDRKHLKTVAVQVEYNGQPVSSPPTLRTMADAKEGYSILLVVYGTDLVAHCRGAETLLRELTFRDRVAVGTITEKGFQLIVGFSADPKVAQGALNELILGAEGEDAEAPLVPLLQSLIAAANHFHGGSLPPQRLLVLSQNAGDEMWSRPSQRRRMVTRMQRVLIDKNIRLMVADTKQSGSGSMGWKSLAQATGGHFVYIPPQASDDPFNNPLRVGYQRLNTALRNRAVVDVGIPVSKTDENALIAVHVSSPTGKRTTQRAVAPGQNGKGRQFLDMAMPPMPPSPSIPGAFQLKELVAEAKRAESNDLLLKAGVLWELAHQLDPKDPEARRQVEETRARLQDAPEPSGTFQYGTTPLSSDIPIKNETGKARTFWKSLTGVEDGLEDLVLPRVDAKPTTDSPATAADVIPINQIVLHRCLRDTADECLRFLLSERSMTHFVVENDGTVVQTADLALSVRHQDGPAYDQIAVHLLLPPPEAPYFQDPGRSATWRQPRVRKTHVEVNGKFQHGWGLTLAQRHSLIALLHELAAHFPNISPLVPIDLMRRPTFAALMNPADHKGVISHSNLHSAVTQCPGPGIDLSLLNSATPKWQRRPMSMDLETWINDLSKPGRSEGAMSRFAEIDPIGAPVLTEVIREVPIDATPPSTVPLATRAVEALSRHASRPSGEILTQELQRMMTTPPPTSPEELRHIQALLLGLVHGGAENQAAIINGLLQRWTLLDADESTPIWKPVLRTGLAALLVSAKRPEHTTHAIPLLEHSDDEVRAGAMMVLGAHDSETVRHRESKLLTDANPWNQLLAIRMLQTKDWKPLNRLVGTIPMNILVAHVHATWPNQPQADTLRWYRSDKLSAADRAALRQLFVRWKWAKSVPLLANQLKSVSGLERWLVTHALRTITGRDFGSSPAGWLRWRPDASAAAP